MFLVTVFLQLDLSKQYWLGVFAPALESWQRGETPNPDVACNREIKFGALLDRVLRHNSSLCPSPSEGARDEAAFGRRAQKTWLVTGHYAGLTYSADGSLATLHRALDRTKDQSYFLSSVPRSALAHVHLPLARLKKPQVRDLARRYRLPAAEQEESMGLCFVGTRRKVSSEGNEHLAKRIAKQVHSTKLREGAFASFLCEPLDALPAKPSAFAARADSCLLSQHHT